MFMTISTVNILENVVILYTSIFYFFSKICKYMLFYFYIFFLLFLFYIFRLCWCFIVSRIAFVLYFVLNITLSSTCM